MIRQQNTLLTLLCSTIICTSILPVSTAVASKQSPEYQFEDEANAYLYECSEDSFIDANGEEYVECSYELDAQETAESFGDRNQVAAFEDFEDSEEVVDNAQLSEIRGGFITSNGMQIDVGLVTRTIVDGLILSESRFNNDQLANIDPAELQTLVQVNPNGANVRQLGLEDIPQVITVIQNNTNNVTIDSLTILNLDVTNASKFNVQLQTPLFNHQAVAALPY